VCKRCNSSFSFDEEYFIAFLGCVLAGSTEPEYQENPRVRDILERSPSLRTIIESSKKESPSADGNWRLDWNPEIDRIKRIVVKNARGHAFYEYAEPMLDDPSLVWLAPIGTLAAPIRGEFETIPEPVVWPEVGSRMLTRLVTGQNLSNGWIVVQEGIYRYAVTSDSMVCVKSVLSEYLATEVRWNS
jgi:hypothetical protein